MTKSKEKLRERRLKVEQMVRHVLFHRYLYYVLAIPTLTDAQYDERERGLKSTSKRAWGRIGIGSERVDAYPDIIHLAVRSYIWMER